MIVKESSPYILTAEVGEEAAVCAVCAGCVLVLCVELCELGGLGSGSALDLTAGTSTGGQEEEEVDGGEEPRGATAA